MRVLNITESTVFLDDIGVAVIYSRNKEPFEIADQLANKSRRLKFAIRTGMLLDVTKGVPADVPKWQPVLEVPADPESPYVRKQSMLVKEDHLTPGSPSVPEVVKRAIYDPHSSSKKGPTAYEVWKNTGIMNVRWHGPTTDAGGYARMNRRFMFGLRDTGVNVKHDPIPSLTDMDAGTNEMLSKLVSAQVPIHTPKVYGMTAPGHYDWDKYKLLFTMMETRQLHKDYVERCNCADEIVVPSRWCKQIFEESGVKKPIEVVPLGVDLDLYKPNVEPIAFSKGLKPFIFLSVFGWSLRKGYDVLLRAYLEEFTSDDPVTLLISARYFGSTDECKKQVIRNDIAKISSMVSNQKKPQVVLFGDVLSDQMMPRLFAAADCYVLVSRGEGFGLPYIEAGACKLPVIASRYSGQTDFLDDENSWLVDVDGFRKAEMTLAWISYFYENAEFPIFGQKAVEQTRFLMRRAFENKEEGEKKANLLHQRVVAEYGWPSCVKKMHDKLKNTYESLKGTEYA